MRGGGPGQDGGGGGAACFCHGKRHDPRVLSATSNSHCLALPTPARRALPKVLAPASVFIRLSRPAPTACGKFVGRPFAPAPRPRPRSSCDPVLSWENTDALPKARPSVMMFPLRDPPDRGYEGNTYA